MQSNFEKDQSILPLGQDLFAPERMLCLISVQFFLIPIRWIKKTQNKTKHPSFLLVDSQDENLTISFQFVSSLGIASSPAQMNWVSGKTFRMNVPHAIKENLSIK